MQNCIWHQHTPVNLSKGMSGIRPTFAAFFMSPITIKECIQGRTPILQKRGGKLHRRFVLEMYRWLPSSVTPRRFARQTHMSLIRRTNAKFTRQSVFALSRQLELTSRVQLYSFGMQLLTDCLCKAIILDDESAAAKASTKASRFLAKKLALLGRSFCYKLVG